MKLARFLDVNSRNKTHKQEVNKLFTTATSRVQNKQQQTICIILIQTVSHSHQNVIILLLIHVNIVFHS